MALQPESSVLQFVCLTASVVDMTVVTAGLIPLWGSSSAECLKWQFWLLRVQSDGLWAGSVGPQDRRIGEDFHRREDLHPGGKVEEGDQTKEADYRNTEEEHTFCELQQTNDCFKGGLYVFSRHIF